MSPCESSARPRPLDAAQLRRACGNAELALRQGSADRRAIEACFAALVNGLEGRLLVSVYVREHDRLWLIAQRGYSEVLDGFSLDHGVMARAVRTGETQLVTDVRDDPDFLEATAGILAEVAVPFGARSGSSAAGALNIETIGATLPPETKDIVEPLAYAVGERLGKMREALGVDVATLVRLCVHTSSLRGSTQIAEFGARTIGRLLGLDCVQVSLRSDVGFDVTSFWRRESSGLEPLAGEDVRDLALLEDETGVSAAYHLFDLRLTNVGHEHLATPWIVWLPLTVGGGSIGAVVGRLSTQPNFEHARVEGATLFAQHVAALLDVSAALRREQHAAMTDSLTGLLNRRGFDERLSDELERARDAGSRVALVLADCDGLKALNDRGGHELGDRVLVAVASCLRGSKRAEDAAARIGGDEFAIILPGAGRDAGTSLAQRLRHELGSLRLHENAPVGATFGVAEFPADGTTSVDLVRAADHALYLAKQDRADGVALPADAA